MMEKLEKALVFAKYFAVIVMMTMFAGMAAAKPVAQIGLLEGSVSVTKANGKRIIVAEGSNLDAGDVIVTGTSSKAMLAFTDGGKIALRPNTVFKIEAYRYVKAKPKEDSAIFKLLKGGLRTVTGLVGKRSSYEAYSMRSQTSTIGIRGTEYIARICETANCNDGVNLKTGKPIIREQPIARVVLLKGKAYKENSISSQSKKPLAKGDAVYLGDIVSTYSDGTVGLLFTDRSRIVLASNTVFNIDTYQYSKEQNQQKKAKKDSMIVRLLKGSARVVTGLIGKRNPKSVKYRTTTSTIGIRGTNFDMACIPSGASQNANSGAIIASTDCSQTLATTVREGAVDLSSDGGTQEVNVGQSAYVDAKTSKPVLVSGGFKLFADGVPLPESLSSDTNKAFGTEPSKISEKGMYVTVIEGKVIVEHTQSNTSVALSSGESGFSGAAAGSLAQRLSSTPEGINFDSSLRSVSFDSFSCGL